MHLEAVQTRRPPHAALRCLPCPALPRPQLLDTQAVGVRREKMYRLDDHIAAAVAGITADANILVNSCRLQAQRYLFTYQVRVGSLGWACGGGGGR